MKKIFMCAMFLFGLLTVSFADELVLSTYYPAPNGVYVNLRASRLAIGDTGQATADGVIHLMPRDGDPSTSWGTGVAGEIAYSSSEQSLMVSNGSGWASAEAAQKRIITVSIPFKSVQSDGTINWKVFSPTSTTGWADIVLTNLPYVACPTGWNSLARNMVFTSSAGFGNATGPANVYGNVYWTGRLENICQEN